MTAAQLNEWRATRGHQATLFTFSTVQGSRGYWLRRCNNGLALRTYRRITHGWWR